MSELPDKYDPQTLEPAVTQRWLEQKAFSATPDERENRYVVMMPLPNVTGALHMGHAMDNVMQDLLTRWHRMRGDNTLWQPGLDHAGIATQAVVERKLYAEEGKTREELGREAFLAEIWKWREEHGGKILEQFQRLGASCDWWRTAFTLDESLSRAVRESFVRLWERGLVYRGARLVNWDCALQTAVSDDEVE